MNATLARHAQAKIDGLAANSLARTLTSTHRLDGVWVRRAGRRLMSFSCNDYLGLTHHPAVKAAAAAAVETYGAGAGASRLVSGDHPLFTQLEARLAALKGAEAACVFGSGYLANLGVIPALVGPGDLVLLDELAHSCIWSGARLSGAEVRAFRHNDAEDLEAKVAAGRAGARYILVATDGVFSMDGDIAPLDDLSRVAQRYGAWLMVDDAHGVGVVGDGAGTAALFPDARIDIQMGTLSKALGSYGAYVCAERPVIELLKMRARTVVYTTGLPPACVAAALAALDVIADEPERVAAPLAKARRFTHRLRLPPAQSAVVAVILGEAETALAAAAALEADGFLTVAIRPPTVPAGASRLRLAFSAGHPDKSVDRLAEAVRPWIAA